jgi:allantoate deiminase
MEKHSMDLKERLLSDYMVGNTHSGVNGERIASRLAQLAQIGLTSEGGSHRLGFSAEERAAKDMVIGWMREAGLVVTEDGAGNVFGRLTGKENQLPSILSGSHVDSVPNGGHFDGPLGVLSALEVVEAWKQTGYQPKKPFEVVIFTDEEGSRFNGGLTGSQAMVGEIDPNRQKKLKDIEGVPFELVLEGAGLSLGGLVQAKRNMEDIETFVEVHIEQGKRLEKANVPVGIVTGIAGPCWLNVRIRGEAGHAGNTPMNDRADALVAASQFILQVEALPSKFTSSAVATVGKLQVHPNGVNVIPGEVRLTVDIRDIHRDTRDQLIEEIIIAGDKIAINNGVQFHFEESLRVDPVPIRKEMQDKLAQSIKAQGIEPIFLPSGAGHDAMIVGRHLPVSMLFVRSQDGVSHNPKEWSSLNDCVQTIHVLKHYVEQLMEG